MARANRNWDLALDLPGSAGAATVRHSVAIAAAIVGIAIVVVGNGQSPFPALPQFATFHAGFIFLVDAIVAFLLMGQFLYRRLPSYLVLAAAYLFSSLVTIPFLLSFPGGLKEQGFVIGESQSAIWVWHFWHILFPLIVALSLLVHRHMGARTIPVRWAAHAIWAAVGVVAVLVALVTAAVTVFHDDLPVLITTGPAPLTPAFYVVGGVAAVVTLLALALALWSARQCVALHIWLAVVLTAFLADVAASLGAYDRYTVGWYFGRIESMIAVAVLLLLFLTQINRLYHRLGAVVEDLFEANEALEATVGEKAALVEQLRERSDEIRKLAYYDVVTGLPNRRMFMEQMEHALSLARRYGHLIGLLFLDLDRFKEVNDTLGHEAGDALLHEVAARLKRCVRSGDIVSRLAGDEFVIILPELARPDHAVEVAGKVIEILNRPLTIQGRELRITASIGIALSGADDSRDAGVLLSRADTAMYEAKKSGRNRYFVAG